MKISGQSNSWVLAAALLVAPFFAIAQSAPPEMIFGPGEPHADYYASETFGKVWSDPSGYAYVESLGWVATAVFDANGYWMADWRGWFWSSPEFAGWVYHYDSRSWLYYYSGGKWFSAGGREILHWDYLPVGAGRIKVFKEKDGLLIMELEHAPLPDLWAFRADTSGYSGAGYLAWQGENNYSKREIGVLELHFEIVHEGNYGLTIRNKIGGTDRGNNNDLNISFQGGQDTTGFRIFGGWFAVFTNETGSWQTDLRGEIDGDHFVLTRYFEPGSYSLRLSPRSTNFHIDRVAFFRKEQFNTLSDSFLKLLQPSDFDVIPVPQ